MFGTLAQRVGSMEKASGGVSAEDIGQTLDALVSDKQVRCIVMQFDSPGGSVFGIPELANKIQSLKMEKKIYGMADRVETMAHLLTRIGGASGPSAEALAAGAIAARARSVELETAT